MTLKYVSPPGSTQRRPVAGNSAVNYFATLNSSELVLTMLHPALFSLPSSLPSAPGSRASIANSSETYVFINPLLSHSPLSSSLPRSRGIVSSFTRAPSPSPSSSPSSPRRVATPTKAGRGLRPPDFNSSNSCPQLRAHVARVRIREIPGTPPYGCDAL